MSNLTRRERESRAYALTLASGGFGVATVVLLVLAVVGAGTGGLAFFTALAAVLSVVLLRRTLHRR